MKTCCQDVPEIKCATAAINERIAPISFQDGVLVIDSPLDTGAPVSISGAEISVVDGHIDIPAKTLLNGTPLISDAFVGDAVPIPPNTTINGYKPTTEQYFYFFSTTSSTLLLNSFYGYIINGQDLTTSNPTVDLRGFPFTAPEDCVLTSLRVSYILTPGGVGVPGDGRVSLDVVDTNLNPFFTGVSYDIVAPAASSNTTFYKEFEYMVRKGDSVGLFVSGTAQSSGGILVFATLGYKILPPLTLTTTTLPLRQNTMLRTSRYNRFPFNGITNARINKPIQFEDQLEILSTNNQQSFYGRKLTAQDYKNRSPPTTDAFNVLVRSTNLTPHAAAHQDAVAFLLSGQKKRGWWVNMTGHDQNTRALTEQHDWQGISYQEGDTDYAGTLRALGAPSTLDFLSFELGADVFESFVPVLSTHTFNFATIRHDTQSTTTNTMLSLGYVKLFSDIVMDDGTKEDWYVRPGVLEEEILEKVQTDPGTRWTECLTLLSIHGSKNATPPDYNTYDDLEKIITFFSGEKRDGTFVDISDDFVNSQRLKQDYGWQGVQVSADDIGSVVVENDADYLSLDRCPVPAFEAFAPTLATRTFGFVSVGHDGDGDAQSVIGNTLQHYGYARVFTDVLVAKSADRAVREDWFAHPSRIVQKIREHPENTEGITSAKCLAIIRMLFDYRF